MLCMLYNQMQLLTKLAIINLTRQFHDGLRPKDNQKKLKIFLLEEDV